MSFLAALGVACEALFTTGLGAWVIVLAVRAARLHASVAIAPPEGHDAPPEHARGALLRAQYPRWAVQLGWVLAIDLLVTALILWGHVAIAAWTLASAPG